MRGIVLAGGAGSRLWPNTLSMSKQLLPIYDKPLNYYPISVLMLSGIKEILIITTPEEQDSFIRSLGDGSNLGISFNYAVQAKPEGLAQAFQIGADFIAGESVALILGDNIFYGPGLGISLEDFSNPVGALIFGYHVDDPRSYGVVAFNDEGDVLSIEEKPSESKSNYAIPGLYFFDNSVVKRARNVKKSTRGEMEITSVLEFYLRENRLKVKVLPRGTAWLDCGTVESMNDAGNYIRVIEARQGLKIGCIEEIAWRKGWIDSALLREIGILYQKNEYGKYLLSLLEE
jgi:glucose-1-phosphate thymidylyltransferase